MSDANEDRPQFVQGVFPFVGRGLYEPIRVDESTFYQVPEGARTRVIYVRAGNHSEDLVYLAMWANGSPIRYFPVGPRDAFHIPLAIQEPHPAGTRLEWRIAAERGVAGSVILDVGLIEERDA